MSMRRGGYVRISVLALLLSSVLATAPHLTSAGAAEPVASFTLSPSRLTETPLGRELLSYLVSCALPETSLVYVPGPVPRRALPGGLGLAPDWRNRPLTQAEQELVSACLLARVNAFGVPVQLSLREASGGSIHPSLNADNAERLAFPVYEGAFFGNVFTNPPQMFACTGDAERDHLRHLRRICTLPDTGKVSACKFTITGPCPVDSPPIAVNREWPTAIKVFLRSSGVNN